MINILELKKLTQTNNISKYDKDIKDLEELNELSVSQDEIEDINIEIKILYKKIEQEIINQKFNFEFAESNCFLTIQAGAGGVESFDWANMLLRMYTRFCNIKQWKTSIISKTVGEEAGIKSCTIKVLGHKSYGYLQNEIGVHRLVRMSPFNSAGKRMTSFASIWVYPEIHNTNKITIDKKDIRIDTFKSSGAGGQHVNTTDSAVRITHIPTGIVTSSQSSRSQHSNKEEAFKMLQSQLLQIDLDLQRKKTVNANKTEVAWGQQIRSYVLHPYNMVKDLRSDFKVGNTKQVLDGDLEEIILSNL